MAIIQGGEGNQSLAGTDGVDKILGNQGNDRMKGGEGTDLFIFHAGQQSSTDFDRIVDWESGGAGDRIDLSGSLFVRNFIETSKGVILVLSDGEGGADGRVLIEGASRADVESNIINELEF